ncbi:hypothetical protein NE237_013626 [Protea cynaroides]|uniref:Uncharacterized protein n=1 Tax=Protea cynaroides TaxID=273540 RepID=A0A9Q0H227_9MAGN|nr:hypothetical protein NE237_013626 [Protea cynaroides]
MAVVGLLLEKIGDSKEHLWQQLGERKIWPSLYSSLTNNRIKRTLLIREDSGALEPSSMPVSTLVDTIRNEQRQKGLRTSGVVGIVCTSTLEEDEEELFAMERMLEWRRWLTTVGVAEVGERSLPLCCSRS